MSERLQYSVKHTADLLDYSPRTVYRLIERGELETTGSGQLLRITDESILAYQERIRNTKEVR
jgi:excisionase family DNA binding protein